MAEATTNITVFNSTEALHNAGARFIIALANKSIAEHGYFTLSLSGGETPKKLYALLAGTSFREQMPWENTAVFWGDERCVPLDDENNNAYQAKSILLDKIDIPSSNIHRIPVDLSPVNAAENYENELKHFFGNKPLRFDLILLGLGENGHTASLFPGSKILTEEKAGIREVVVEKNTRITMTAPLINQAENILFLVSGEKKASILEQVLYGAYQPDRYPAQLIKPINGKLFWFIDQAAAVLINPVN